MRPAPALLVITLLMGCTPPAPIADAPDKSVVSPPHTPNSEPIEVPRPSNTMSSPSLELWSSSADPAEKLMSSARLFCSRAWSSSELLGRLSPEAIRAGGVLLPPGQRYFIESEATLSLFLNDPDLQVIWWLKPRSDEDPITEIHIVPQRPSVVYGDFVRRYELLGGTPRPPTHALSDIEHEHTMVCEQDEAMLLINEIVWQGDVVGKIGQIAVFKTPPVRATSIDIAK